MTVMLDLTCRFQARRSLSIAPHGSGIKLTINEVREDMDPEHNTMRKSVFLDNDAARALTECLLDQGFGERVSDDASDKSPWRV